MMIDMTTSQEIDQLIREDELFLVSVPLFHLEKR
jgi:hypothetical protein